MGLTMKEKRSVAGVTAPSYKAASKKQKGIILKQFIKALKRNFDIQAWICGGGLVQPRILRRLATA
ncbi:MAG: hypothetical protein AABN33_12390 [Acidobacteriota bacterium]